VVNDQSLTINYLRQLLYVRLPEAVEKAGLFGADMTALTAYLKGRSHMSYRTPQAYFHDTMGVVFCVGVMI